MKTTCFDSGFAVALALPCCRRLFTMVLALAGAALAHASVNETNTTCGTILTVSVRQDSYSWNGSQWQYVNTSLWSSALSYGQSLAVFDWDDGTYRIDYSVAGTSSAPGGETWTAFEEVQPWSYGAWSPDCSTTPSCQMITQSRTKTRQRRTGERSNCGNERNVTWHTDSGSEVRSVNGCRAPTWTAFSEPSSWAEVSASPSCSSYSVNQSFAQSYTEQRFVRTGERNECGEERNVTTTSESRTLTRTVWGCAP